MESYALLIAASLNAGTLLAIAATLLKLLMNLPGLDLELPLAEPEALHELMTTASGFLAIVLPLVAVAALSLAGAHDFDARAATYRDMHTFLRSQKARLTKAATQHELARLVLETEYRLLGETVTWYSRRLFAAVA